MQFFPWTPNELEIRIPMMDADHKVIVDLMNRLHSLHHDGAPRSAIEPILDELIAVTIQHFRAEEELMRSIRFPEYENHRRVHLKLLDRLNHFVSEFKRSGNTLMTEFFVFLRVWLTAHIQGLDRRYAEHAKKLALGGDD